MFRTYTERGQQILREQYVRGWYDLPGSRCYRRNCHHCSVEFFAQRPEARYCSYRCTNDAYIKRRKLRREENREKKCVACGVDFTAKRNDAKYCCGACKQKAYRKNVTALCSPINGQTNSSNTVTDTG
ncbi:hypothetical protein ABD77_00790 [Brevibacillus formosus]|nr:hypothetical protein [Brevibacillus formosus]